MGPKRNRSKGKKKAHRIKMCDRDECKVGVNLKNVKHSCPTCQIKVYCSADCLQLDKDDHECISVTQQLENFKIDSERVVEKYENDPNKPDISPKLTDNEQLNVYKLANEGNAKCQYILGCAWAKRISADVLRMTDSYGPELSNIDWSTVPVTESNTKAAKYFKMAAKNGSMHAMESYAERLSKGDGVARSMRSASDWHWKAYSIGKTSDQRLQFRKSSVLCKDWNATKAGLAGAIRNPSIPSNATISAGGPNVASLLLTLASGPTRLLRLLNDEDGLPFIDELREVQAVCSAAKFNLSWTHGRLGTMKNATSMAIGNHGDVLCTVQYKVGSRLEFSDMTTSLKHSSPVDYSFVCSHFPSGGVQDCMECCLEGMTRVYSVDNGWYFLSEQAVVEGMFFQAIVWDGKQKVLKQENFKPLCKAEVDLTLRVMARISPLYCNPFHIASMPSLLWPIVYYYGSIRDALDAVVPIIDWNEYYGEQDEVDDDYYNHEAPSEDIKAMFSSASSDEFYYKCDNTTCCKVGDSFSRCRCLKVRYCGKVCQKQHRKPHKSNCVIP